jgi:hypothetical protein
MGTETGFFDNGCVGCNEGTGSDVEGVDPLAVEILACSICTLRVRDSILVVSFFFSFSMLHVALAGAHLERSEGVVLNEAVIILFDLSAFAFKHLLYLSISILQLSNPFFHLRTGSKTSQLSLQRRELLLMLGFLKCKLHLGRFACGIGTNEICPCTLEGFGQRINCTFTASCSLVSAMVGKRRVYLS